METRLLLVTIVTTQPLAAQTTGPDVSKDCIGLRVTPLKQDKLLYAMSIHTELLGQDRKCLMIGAL